MDDLDLKARVGRAYETLARVGLDCGLDDDTRARLIDVTLVLAYLSESCRFCGTIHGHTSSCYERKLNRMRAALRAAVDVLLAEAKADAGGARRG